jgi:UrcA family protein
MRSYSMLLAAVALAAAVAQPALSQTHSPVGSATVQLRVSSQGLDLTTEAGAAQFLQRLSHAASQVCGGPPDASPLRPNNAARIYRQCQDKALSDVVAQSQWPLVRQQYAADRHVGSAHLAAR